MIGGQPMIPYVSKPIRDSRPRHYLTAPCVYLDLHSCSRYNAARVPALTENAMSTEYRRPGIRLLPLLLGALAVGFIAVKGCQEGPFGRKQIVAMNPAQE